MKPAPQRPGESAADFKARVKASEEKWKAGMGRPKTGGGGAASGDGRPGHMGPGSGGAPVSGGRPGGGRGTGMPPKPTPPKPKGQGGGMSTGGGGGPKRNMGPGSGGAPVSGGRGIVKGLNPPKKSAPREKVAIYDTKGQRIKDRKPVLYSGPGMKRGGMVKAKKC